MSRTLLLQSAVSAALLMPVGCSLAELNRFRGDPYALDEVERNISEPAAELACRPELLVSYRGEHLELKPPTRVAEPFRARLQRFESLVAELGERFYGRAPSHLLHAGTYACRAVDGRRSRLSEHALGNAIDVTGFRFPAQPTASSHLTTREPGAREFEVTLPERLHRPFSITVSRDWPRQGSDPDEVSAIHHRFFDALTQTLLEKRLFRGVIGPPDPRHETHLHLDMAPWPYRRL